MAQKADNRSTSFAFAGSGVAEPETVAELLNDLLPQDFDDATPGKDDATPGIGAVYRPTHVDHGDTPGLDVAVTWLEKELGKRNIQASDDLIDSLLHRKSEKDHVRLVMVWPETPTDEEKALVLAAREQGIRVLNLAAANNDLLWEPEPPADDTAEEAEAESITDILKGIGDENLADKLLLAIRAFVVDIALEVYESKGVQTVPAPAPAKAPAPRTRAAKAATPAPAVSTARDAEEIIDPPPFDGPFVDPAEKTFPFYKNKETGAYRLVTARSKFRRDEEAADLTAAQIKQAVKDKKLSADQVPPDAK